MEITIPENVKHSDITFTVTFSSSIGNQTLTIVQEGAIETLIGDRTSVGSDMNGDSNSVKITSNIEWYSATSDEWIRVTPSEGGIGVTDVNIITEKNPTVDDRVGYVYFKSKETETTLFTIKVTQGKLVEVIKINPNYIVFDADGGTATITIMSNTSWTIE
jgi:hypothetical protein